MTSQTKKNTGFRKRDGKYSRFLSTLLSGALLITAVGPTYADQYIFRGAPTIIETVPTGGNNGNTPGGNPGGGNGGTNPGGNTGGGTVTPPVEARAQLTITGPENMVLRRLEAVTTDNKAVVANAVATVVYSVAPALPLGLVLNQNGTITGQPTVEALDATYTITATDGVGGSLGTATATFRVAVDPRVALAVEGESEAVFERSSSSNEIRLSPSKTATVYGKAVWKPAGTVPDWIKTSQEGNDLVISGAPTVVDAVGTKIAFTIADDYDVSSAHQVVIKVVREADAKVVMPTTIQNELVFLTPYYQDIAAKATLVGYSVNELTWKAEADKPGDALIPGVSLTGDGLLEGQPLASGTYAFTIKAMAGTTVVGSAHYTFKVTAEVAAKVAATMNSSCMLTAAGDVKCWGNGNYGKLGNGSGSGSAVPVAATVLSGKFKDLTGGYSGHMCALRSDDTVWCWGNGTSGQLGNGANVSNGFPSQVVGLTNVRSIQAGYTHTCATKNDGSMWCWGHGLAVGYGSTANVNVPTQVKGLDSGVISMATGSFFSCASRSNGDVFCWGNNGDGRLGDGTTTNRTVPTPVSGLRDVISMTGGYDHACATKYDKTVVCWGQAYAGQLGNNETQGIFPTPQPVIGLSNTYFLTTGDHHSCAIKTDRSIVCWGSNTNGQIGDGSNTDRAVPGAVNGLNRVSSVTTVGYKHTCAAKTDGSVWCWGDNGSGQLGDGTTTGKSTPVRVSGT